MAKYADFTSNFDDYKQILEFKKDFRENVIDSGLDKILDKSLEQLKSDLKFLVNEKIRVIQAEDQRTAIAPTEKTPLGQPYINPPKSDKEILEYLTDGKTDLSKYNKAKDYTTLSETGVVFGHYSTGQSDANRVTLRMEIDPEETVEEQYVKAKKFFREAIFALPSRSGDLEYFSNPGIDISEHVKIKCSTLTGAGDAEPFEGMSPEQRFQRDRHRKGYAQWTLKQEAVDKIRNSFLNLTDIVDLIKEGDYDRAKSVLLRDASRGKFKETSKIMELTNKLNDLKENKNNVPMSMRNYSNVLDLINNLQTVKKVSTEGVVYSLVSSYDDIAPEQVNFEDSIQRAIRNWVTINENKWFEELILKTENLLKLYTSTFISNIKS